MDHSTSRKKILDSDVQDPAVEVEYPPSAKFRIDGYGASEKSRLGQIGQAKEVVPWPTDTIINAHCNSNTKHAAVQLLLVEEFTLNLGFLRCWDPLRTGLILTALSAQLHDRYNKLDLGNALSNKRVGCDKLKYHSLLSNNQQDHTAQRTHADLLPHIYDVFDFSADHLEAMDERALLVVIVMIASRRCDVSAQDADDCAKL